MMGTFQEPSSQEKTLGAAPVETNKYGVPNDGNAVQIVVLCVLRLALGELERTTCLALTEFLTLDNAAVAGEEAVLLQNAAQLRLVMCQSLGQAVADSASLTGETTAGDRCNNIILAVAIGQHDRLTQDHLQNRASEILGEVLAVNGDLAGARFDPDASNRILTFAGCVGAALCVQFLDVDRCFGGCGFDRAAQFFQGLQLSHC